VYCCTCCCLVRLVLLIGPAVTDRHPTCQQAMWGKQLLSYGILQAAYLQHMKQCVAAESTT
jgi:hypothetical protein